MKASSYPTPPSQVERADELDLPGRLKLVKGREVSISRERGRFRFLAVETNLRTGDQWVTVWGPVSGDGQRAMFRSFGLDRIRRVHSKAKGRPAD